MAHAYFSIGAMSEDAARFIVGTGAGKLVHVAARPIPQFVFEYEGPLTFDGEPMLHDLYDLPLKNMPIYEI